MVNTSCAVSHCGSTSHKHNGVKFHQFPRDERSLLWIQACKREDLKGKDADQLKHMHICSLHFEQRMYGKQLLKKSAVPTLNLPTTMSRCTYTQTDNYEPDVLQVFTSQGVQTDEELNPRTPVLPRLPTTKNMINKMEDCCISREQFLLGCDAFLPSSLSSLIKSQINLSLRFNDRNSLS